MYSDLTRVSFSIEEEQEMLDRLKLLPIAIAAGSSLLAMSPARAEGVEYHGYVRTQVGGTTAGGNLQCFQAGGPVRAKYRLGNECDNYGEASIGLPFGDSNDVWAKYKLTVALQESGKQDYESVNDKTFNLASRENYFEAGGFFKGETLENSRVWVGKRFYNRHDIHMNDYYYWGNSGAGAGIEEINLGVAKMSYAYFQNGGNANDASDLVGKRYSIRLYDIDVNPGGKLETEIVSLKGSTAGSAEEGSGSMIFLKHSQSGVLGGFNHLALVYGSKLGSGFEWLPTYQGAAPAQGHSWRIHDHLYFDLKGTGISGTATASYGKANSGGANDNTWKSIGVRPQYNFTNNFSVAVEAGRDWGETDSGAKPALTKFTIAPQLALSPGVWARPVLRAFVTHASWNDDAGKQANGVFGTKTSGTTFGLQAEAWW